MAAAAAWQLTVNFAFDDLRRWPDFEAPELRAWDAADTLILDEARPLLNAAELTVIGDDFGALTLGALADGASRVRVHQDPLTGELALRANALAIDESRFESLGLVPELVAGATLVLLRLPRSLEALNEIAALIAAHASPEVVVIAGGRLKHMSLGMNEVLQRHFGQLDVSLARQKSRLLIARVPMLFSGNTAGHPHSAAGDAYLLKREQQHADVGLTVVATGGVFAGTGIDIGTRALIEQLGRVAPFESALDLGCGTGILAALLARAKPTAHILATDQSAAAVASARLTAEANGLEIEVFRDDAASQVPDASVDLVVLNPPFHTGAAVDSRIALKFFEAAARVLKPRGELWVVFNSHLAYRPMLDRIVGSTSEVSRNTKFTVTKSIARGN